MLPPTIREIVETLTPGSRVGRPREIAMKPRILATYKILAVAVTAAGCSEPAAERPHAEVAASPVSPQTMGAAASSAETAAPERPMSTSPALLALQGELSDLQPDAALAQQARFRPLCDAEGYPLVGNLREKGVRIEASAFCADVRAKKAPR